MARARLVDLQDLEEYGGEHVRPSECARILDCSTTYIHKLIAAGSVADVIRVGTHYRIPTRELRRLVLELRISPTTPTSPTV